MHKSPGGGPGSCEEERVKCCLDALVPLRDLDLLAQEGTSLFSCIDNDDGKQCGHVCNQKHFHAHRITRSRASALYSEFANTKQL